MENKDDEHPQELEDLMQQATSLINEVNNTLKYIEIQRVQGADNERTVEVVMNMNINFLNSQGRASAAAPAAPQNEPIPTAVNVDDDDDVELMVLEEEPGNDTAFYKPQQEDDIIFVGETRNDSIVDLCTPDTAEKTKKKHKKDRRKEKLNISAETKGNDRTKSEHKCAICMESTIKRKPTATKCGHVFCLACIDQAVKLTKKCPLCKTKLGNKSFHRIYL